MEKLRPLQAAGARGKLPSQAFAYKQRRDIRTPPQMSMISFL